MSRKRSPINSVVAVLMCFAHQLSITIGQFVRDLEIIAKASLDGECENQIFRLPL